MSQYDMAWAVQSEYPSADPGDAQRERGGDGDVIALC